MLSKGEKTCFPNVTTLSELHFKVWQVKIKNNWGKKIICEYSGQALMLMSLQQLSKITKNEFCRLCPLLKLCSH